MADIKDRAREYIAKHSEYSEAFGQTFVAVDTFTAMVEFAEQETKELKAQIEKMKCCEICKHYQGESCNYHSNWVKDCKENGMKLFELKEIKENE
jgi:hypothetical protein